MHAIVGETYTAATEPTRASGRIACIAHHFTRDDEQVTDVAWYLRYDDEYVRTDAGWRFVQPHVDHRRHRDAAGAAVAAARAISRMRAWVVWSVGLLAYIVAVLDRTTLGVSGLEAASRFGASPGVLSSFVVLQVVVYAGAQVPAGVLLDKFGSKTLIASGAALMAAGQLTLAFTTVLPVGDRSARSRRPRRCTDVHLGTAAGAALVSAAAGAARHAVDRHLRPAGPSPLGRTVFRVAHRPRMDHRLHIGGRARSAVDCVDALRSFTTPRRGDCPATRRPTCVPRWPA